MTSKKPQNKAAASQRAASAAPALPASTGGFKVQIIYLAAHNSSSAKAPVKDALWFATYPIIPRLGDCLFRDGVYYRVERVCLYENTAPGWCADIEVAYYGRR